MKRGTTPKKKVILSLFLHKRACICTCKKLKLVLGAKMNSLLREGQRQLDAHLQSVFRDVRI